MTTTQITLTDTAAAIVKSDIGAFTRDGKRYADYVAEMSVTTETVAAHVAMFREAFKAAKPKASGDDVKAYATKVRNGLNRHVVKATPDETVTDYVKRVIKATEEAHKHEVDAETILKAVQSALGLA